MGSDNKDEALNDLHPQGGQNSSTDFHGLLSIYQEPIDFTGLKNKFGITI